MLPLAEQCSTRSYLEDLGASLLDRFDSALQTVDKARAWWSAGRTERSSQKHVQRIRGSYEATGNPSSARTWIGRSSGPVHSVAPKPVVLAAPHIRPFFQPNGQLFQLKHSGKPRSPLTNKAREKLVQEYWQLKYMQQAQRCKRTCAELYAHYRIAQQSAQAIISAAQRSTSSAAKQKSGRPRVFGAEAEEQYVRLKRGKVPHDKVPQAMQGRYARDRTMANSMGLLGVQGAPYRGQQRDQPSRSTMNRMRRRLGFVGRRTKVTPKHDDANKRDRKAWCEAHKGDDQTLKADGDEKWFFLPVALGPGDYRGDSSDDEDLYPAVRHKRHIPKVMALGFVSQPVPSGPIVKGQQVEWKRDGKIGIWRCCVKRPAKKGKKKKHPKGHPLEGQPIEAPPGPRGGKRFVWEYKKGDLRFEDVNVSGETYSEIILQPGGPRDKIKEYFADVGAVRSEFTNTAGVSVKAPVKNDMQEDGAPGHGYNNRAGRKPTAPHVALEKKLLEDGIRIVKQVRNSPELNALDLGVWFALDAAVKKRYKEIIGEWTSYAEILDALFRVIEEEFWKLDPRTLYNIFEHKKCMMELVASTSGETIKKEPHFGVRRKTGFFT
jgi:hypothetical protein